MSLAENVQGSGLKHPRFSAAGAKHVVQGGEFPGITTRPQFAKHIEDVVSNGVMRPLGNGRSAYWHDGTVVIRNPSAADGGTAFRPTNGYESPRCVRRLRSLGRMESCQEILRRGTRLS